MKIPEDQLDAMDRMRWQMTREARQGASRLEPMTAAAVRQSEPAAAATDGRAGNVLRRRGDGKRRRLRSSSSSRKHDLQRDGDGDAARQAALASMHERLRSMQRLGPEMDAGDEAARRAMLRLCEEQQDALRTLTEEMIRLAPSSPGSGE